MLKLVYAEVNNKKPEKSFRFLECVDCNLFDVFPFIFIGDKRLKKRLFGILYIFFFNLTCIQYYVDFSVIISFYVIETYM